MYTTPILSASLQAQIDRAVVSYKHADTFTKWGLQTIRQQGICILLEGPPGTGKTTIANYLSIKVRKKGIRLVNMADFASHIPGEGARQLRHLFAECERNGRMTIFMDECESVLFSRDMIAGSNTWMLEIINEALSLIAQYKGLIILATNRADLLDAAVLRRLIAKIHVGLPDLDTRLALWQSKWPAKFPLKLSQAMAERLAALTEGMTGATVERIIINAAGRAIEAGRLPREADVNDEIHEEKLLLAKA